MGCCCHASGVEVVLHLTDAGLGSGSCIDFGPEISGLGLRRKFGISVVGMLACRPLFARRRGGG